jgi:hypothetical protein
MDWNAFVNLVSPIRLEVLGIALAITFVLGILGALKSKSFEWTLLANFLAPSLSFFWMILGYIVVAALAGLIDERFTPAVIGTYVVVVASMVAKIKEQISFLAPGLPVTNWKLPLETKKQ